MTHRAVIAVLLGTLFVAAAAVASGERVLRRTFVPTASRPQGEVRLVAREGSAVVQVLLWSRILRRVGTEISEKEENNWPDPSTEGGAASRRYREAVDESIEEVLGESEPSLTLDGRLDPPPPGKIGLLIELSSTSEGGAAAFFSADVEPTGSGFALVRSREIRRIELPAAYATENLRLVVADSFGIDEAEAAAAIEAATAP